MNGNSYDIVYLRVYDSLLVNNTKLNIWKTQLILKNSENTNMLQNLGLKGLITTMQLLSYIKCK